MSDHVLYGPDGRQVEISKAGVPIDAASPALGAGSGGLLGGDMGGQATALADLELYYMLVTKHPYVRGCAELIADTVSSEGFDIVPAGSEDARPLSASDDKRVGDICEFFKLAAPKVTDRGRRFAITIDLKSFGYSILRIKRVPGRGAKGMIAALERIDPRTLSVRLNAAKTAIAKWVVRQVAGGLQAGNVVDEIDPRDIVFFSPSGGDPLTGFASPLEALDLTLATDFAQRRFRQAFCSSGAKAGLILTSDTYEEDAFKAARLEIERNRSGAQNAYKTMLLPGGWKVANVPNAGKDDADFVQASGLNREDVCAVYKVPVGMLTFSKSALGSAGKGADQDFFEQFAVLPTEEVIYERLTLSILRDEFGITDLEIVPKRRNRLRLDRFEAAAQLVKFGGTGNEARRLVNLAPIDDERYDMDAPLFLSTAFTGGIADQEPLHATDDTGQTAPAQTEGDAGEAAGAAGDAREVAQKGARRFRARRFRY